MANYISNFDMYKGAGKTLLGLIAFFFTIHMLMFFYSLMSKNRHPRHQPGTLETLQKRLTKIIEQEVTPTLLVMVVVIIARGLTVESAVVVVVLIAGYVALLIGEFFNRPDLKIIGKVGYGMATMTLAALSLLYYNVIDVDVNNS